MSTDASLGRRMLSSLLLAGLFAACCGYGVRGAFNAATANAANVYTAGTVTIADNDTGTALYNASNVLPGTTYTRCIKVTYTGTLDATVTLARDALGGSLGPYVNLTVTRGTGDDPACSDFAADATVYTGTLSSFPTSASPIALTTGAGGSTWTATTSVTYRFSVNVTDTTSAQGLSTGTHALTWTAANA